MAIFSVENVPKRMQIVSKWAENFAQNQTILKLIANFLYIRQSGEISPNLVTQMTSYNNFSVTR